MMASIPKTMKAAQLLGYKKKYEINDVPVPQLGDNDVLLKVGAAGFCHTDYQVWEGVYESPFPMIPSHEPVGTVVAVGPKVSDKWKIGQRAGVLLFRHQCHSCLGCEATRDIRFCDRKDLAGLKSDGGMAEYIIGDGNNMVLIPDSVPFEQAAPLMCAGATVWGAILEAGLPSTEPIGIIGIGGLGELAVQFAKAMGYPVVAVDDREEGRALATQFAHKADLVIDYNDVEATTKIKSWAGKGGLAGVVVCTDDVPATEWSTKLLRPKGICVPLGLPTSGFQFDAFDTVFGMKQLRMSLVASKEQAQDMLEFVAKFGILSKVTTVPLEIAPELPGMYMDEHLKGRLVMKISS